MVQAFRHYMSNRPGKPSYYSFIYCLIVLFQIYNIICASVYLLLFFWSEISAHELHILP